MARPGEGTIIIAGQAHAYGIRYSRRRTLGLYVSRDRSIQVRAPLDCPLRAIHAFVLARSNWLVATLDRLASLPEPPRPAQWADGAGHLYLNESLTLRVRRGRRPLAVRNGDDLLVTVKEHAPEQVRGVVLNWYRRSAMAVFQHSLEQWFPLMALPETRRPGLKIRAMRRRWGSCASHGGINLNLWLIRAPRVCVDYVVVHELCHLHEFNHSPAFHGWMDRIMPDWRHHRELLRLHERDSPPVA